MGLRFAFVLFVALVGAASSVAAQDSRVEAREAFQAGVAAARASDWATAHDRFAEAYRLAPRAGVLLNLAGAQRRTGRLVESAASYRRWLDEVSSGADAARRPQVSEALAEVEAAIPRLTIEATDLGATDRVRLDDAQDVVPGAEVLVDPGSHVAAIVRDERVVAQASVELAEGGRETITLIAPAIVPTAREVASAELAREEDETRAVVASTGGDDSTVWIALGVGLGVVVIGAVVAGIVVATQPAAETPFQGTFGPGMVRL